MKADCAGIRKDGRMQELISVIVPVYNISDCLPRCVDSIRRQTYSNLEIILVDDGSDDGTEKLADELAAMDERIRVFHKPNGGSSSARNLGIRKATGKYLGFVDSDDYIEPQMYEKLMECIREKKVPMAQISRDEIDEAGNRLPDVCKPPKEAYICDGESFMRELLLHRGDCSYCTKLTDRELFERHRFPEGVLNEDFHLLTEMLQEIEGVAILPEQYYHVFYRTGSNTRKKTKKEFSRVFMDIVDNADMAERIVAKRYPALQEEAVRFGLYQRLDYMLHIPVERMEKGDAFYQSVKRYLRGHIWDTVRNPFLSGKNKIYLLLLTAAPKTVRRLHGWKMQKGHLWLAAFFGLLCLQMLLLLYFGDRKAGFHEDEYYSYYSSNRTAGLFEPDREWMEKDVFRNEFVVLEGEGFRYGLVSTVQSWDVHPPLFYFILHTICSFFPCVFSKWLGIGINIAAFGINFILLSWLAYMTTGKNKGLTFAVAVVHGCNAAIISGVMFIRMYEWLTVFVLLCACLHVRAVIKKDTGVKHFLLPLMAVNYLGFLTQYYYIIFLIFMAIGFLAWTLWKDRKLKNGIAYGMACGISLILAIISYPACLSHIFRGYRGTGAASEFLNVENTGERLGFFAGLVNEYLFNGYLWIWLLLIAVMLCAITVKRKKMGNREGVLEGRILEAHMEAAPYFLLLFAAGGYFFTVSKTALLLFETSNRYQLPVYGVLLLLVMAAIYELWSRAVCLYGLGNTGKGRKFGEIGVCFLFLLFFLGNVHGLISGKVIFLYEEDRANVEYAEENAHMPVIVLYNDATPYHVWWCSQELMQYDRVYFASEGNLERIEDEIICGSGKVIVYAADCKTKEESLTMIQESNSELEGRRLVAQKGLWSVYELE